MGELKKAKLPMDYAVYVFDLYGTLVDIHTDENDMSVWEKLSLFYGYYGASYKAKYSHEASPEIEIEEVFRELYLKKGVVADDALAVHTGQFFRVLTTEYVCLYKGTEKMLARLREAGKKVYLLSNAQRIFTEYEMRSLDLMKFFDGIMISSDYKTKKPDKRFFDILLEKYEIDPKKALFIGNDSRSDIAGAKGVGMDTFYINSNISPAGDNGDDAMFFVREFKMWS